MSTVFVAEAPPCTHSCSAEKDEAREIQNSLLPSGTLRNNSIEIAYRFSPFGDVVGKGIAAAMYAALVMGMLRGINKTDERTSTVLAVLNKRLLVRPVQGRFATTLYAVYDPAPRE